MLITEKEQKEIIISWKKELLLTILMLGLLLFFATWQIIDHLRLCSEQDKIISYLKNDIATALAGILNSQPRFGPIVLKEPTRGKINDLMQSGKGNPLQAVALFNAQDQLLLDLKKENINADWYSDNSPAKSDMLKVSHTYSAIAQSAGLAGSEPVIGTQETVVAMINLVSGFSADEKVNTGAMSPNDSQIGDQVRKILSEDYFKKKTVHRVVYLLDVAFLHKTITKDLMLRSVSLLFCLIAFALFTYSLFNLHRNVKLKILLAQEQEKNAHFREMNLLSAGLAHEIRNPLNLVRGLTQSIAELSKNSADIRKKTTTVAEEVDRINSRLNSFLAYSNLKPPSPKELSCKQVIDEIIGLLSVDAEEKNIGITRNLKDEKVWADEESLRQIIFNLMHNAIKSVDRNGRITVSSGRINKKTIWLQVADNGPGVPPEAREDIFKPYFTLDSAGTGLGLALVKQLSFNHGWKIRYIGDKNNGAVFRLEGIKLL